MPPTSQPDVGLRWAIPIESSATQRDVCRARLGWRALPSDALTLTRLLLGDPALLKDHCPARDFPHDALQGVLQRPAERPAMPLFQRHGPPATKRELGDEIVIAYAGQI